jgi:hypothetical protein
MESNRIEIGSWVRRARSNQKEYRRRQVVHVLFECIADDDELRKSIYLKGGALMSLGYESDRMTGDVDFTTVADKENFESFLKNKLSTPLTAIARRLGYGPMECAVQSTRWKPSAKNASFPTLEIRIGSAMPDEPDYKNFKARRATQTAKMEISFNEPTKELQALVITEDTVNGKVIFAYSTNELIAEKTRAFLQQSIRNRKRRQDIYDIALLIRSSRSNEIDLNNIYAILLAKCEARGIFPTKTSIDDLELIGRAQAEYDTLALEIDADSALDFDSDFGLFRDLYQSLPWPDEEKDLP